MRWKCFLAGGCIGAAVLLFPRFPSKAAEAEGSKPIYEYRFEHNVMVPMKDGTKLATDIYIPKTDKPVPALVVRTPYNKELSSNPEYGKYYASRGYAVAIQDVRGRFASEGEFYNYLNDGDNEHKDGYDAIEWIGRQMWCDGRIGMWGSSYVGATQWQAAVEHPHVHVGIANRGLAKQQQQQGGAVTWRRRRPCRRRRRRRRRTLSAGRRRGWQGQGHDAAIPIG